MEPTDDYSWMRVLYLVLLPLALLFRWYRDRATSTTLASASSGSSEGTALPDPNVALLRKSTYALDVERVGLAAERAWTGEAWPGELQQPAEWVELIEGAPMIALHAGGGTFFVTPVDGSLFDQGGAKLSAKVPAEERAVLLQHRAWVNINLMHGPPAGVSIAAAYQALGRLAAELLDRDTVGFCFPRQGVLGVVGEATPEFLRSPTLLADATWGAQGPVLQVGAHDEAMAAATARARAELPEFMRRFRTGEGVRFAVKVPLTADGVTEHVWMEVRAIDEAWVEGTLSNAPEKIRGWAFGQPMKVALSEVEDWLVVTSQSSQAFDGGYTARLLQDR